MWFGSSARRLVRGMKRQQSHGLASAEADQVDTALERAYRRSAGAPVEVVTAALEKELEPLNVRIEKDWINKIHLGKRAFSRW